MNYIRFISLFLICQLGWNNASYGQIIDDIADQVIEVQDTFTTININDFILSGINCADIAIKPIIEGGTSTPSAVCDGESILAYQGNMTAYIKVNFAGLISFNHKNDSIIAYAPDGNVIGCGKHPENLYEVDQELFLINIAGDVAPFLVDLELYSSELKQHFRLSEALTYRLNDNKSSAWDNPFVIDASPLKADTTTMNQLKVNIEDADWRGERCFEVTISGCLPDNRGSVDKDTICFSIIPNKFCEEDYNLSNEIFTNQEFAAVKSIVASNVLQSSATVLMTAGESITLKAGFHAKTGVNFTAKIADCELPASGLSSSPETTQLKEEEIIAISIGSNSIQLEKSPQMKLVPNPAQEEVNIRFFLPMQEEKIQLYLMNISGQYVKYPISITGQEGWNERMVSLEDFPAGVYFVALQTKTTILNTKLIKH